MSYLSEKKLNRRFSIFDLKTRKQSKEKVSMVTCYDAAFGRLIEESPIDMVLVGDSLGNVILGYADTIPVTMDDMVHHTAAVSRVVQRALVVGDMPFMSVNVSDERALCHAARLIQEGGAQAVKIEGGESVCSAINKIVHAGIPVFAHLGLTPQSVHALGGYRVQGKSSKERKLILENAKRVQDAGASALVLELVPGELAKEITTMLEIPTIGIGAGVECDGQVLVLHDLLGFQPQFRPKFLKRYAELHELIGKALQQYDAEVKQSIFPGVEHTFYSGPSDIGSEQK